MKKLFPFFAALVFAIIMSSCSFSTNTALNIENKTDSNIEIVSIQIYDPVLASVLPVTINAKQNTRLALSGAPDGISMDVKYKNALYNVNCGSNNKVAFTIGLYEKNGTLWYECQNGGYYTAAATKK